MKRSAIPITLLLCLLTASISARVRTRRTYNPADSFFVADTIVPSRHDVVLSGYDKPHRSSSETFFMTNNSERDIIDAVITINYYDTDSTLIHSRSVHTRSIVPAGETRAINIPSWDRQQSFRHIDSRAGRSPSTPYFVRQSVDTVFSPHR